jgi:hypothetical protein
MPRKGAGSMSEDAAYVADAATMSLMRAITVNGSSWDRHVK